MILSLQSMTIIVLCVVTSGLALSRLFHRLETMHLVTVSGPPAYLILARVLVWLLAIAVSGVVAALLFALLPVGLALALFFGCEAVILDIASQRVAYERVVAPAPIHISRMSSARHSAHI